MTESDFKYSPEKDGIDHINVYSKSQTELGRMLSNFAHVSFEHPVYGHFSSIEGFWYWLSTNKQQNDFRGLYGFKAKQVGKLLQEELKKTGVQNHVENFKQEIKQAILLKIEQNQELKQLLKESVLPLTHYYFYGELPDVRISEPKEYRWIHEYISDVRDWLNGKAYKLMVSGSRGFNDYEAFKQYYLDCGFKAIQIIQGECSRGVDALAHKLASELEIPEEKVPAKWDKADEQGKTYFDKAAGMFRNAVMLGMCDAGLIVWDGISPGTKNALDRIKLAKKPYRLIVVDQHSKT